MTNKRHIYLQMKSLQAARSLVMERFGARPRDDAETVSVPEAVGRVLIEPVYAAISSPNFHAAAMDGIAVRAEATFGASETRPRQLEIGREAFLLNTGHVLPEGTNAVIMIENVQILGNQRVEIDAPAFPWQHVRRVGEDIVATELLFPRNHRVTPYCVGALLSAGIRSVSVRSKPRILIVPTGSELVDWQTMDPKSLQPGQVIESNSAVLGKLAEGLGASVRRHDPVPDSVAAIGDALESIGETDADIVMTLGGSSAGSEDYARKVIEEIGELYIHGVTMMPGKPVLVGAVHGKPVFGIPGYPVSAIMAFEQLVQPLILRLLGLPEEPRPRIAVETSRKVPSKLGIEEFLRVKLGRVGDRVVAAPLPRGAGCITTLTEADAIIRIPAAMEGLNEGESVEAELIRPAPYLDQTILIVGSHDNTLDVLADELRRAGTGLTLSSSHVGSMGGLMAIRRGVCHLAGAHLLDTENGTYNDSYIRRYLPGTPVHLVNLVMRQQGLIVPSGNPKNINGIEDLARSGIRFVNRQGGSGTRILLDYRLAELGIDPESIDGYATEEFTHMAVAVAVLSGLADTGLGICAAAGALGLDFVPVVTEQYDLVIPDRFFDTPKIRVLLETISGEPFKTRVQALGGYDTGKTGECRRI
ncbi:MAG: molybdopterin biosynthesis protein [Desulfobacterales bacterium]